jgi:hypothetical protein
MNLRCRIENSEEEYLLFVHQDRSPEDAEAERILSEFLGQPRKKATLRVNERRESETKTPALYVHFDYFSGIDEIKAFVEHERLLIP